MNVSILISLLRFCSNNTKRASATDGFSQGKKLYRELSISIYVVANRFIKISPFAKWMCSTVSYDKWHANMNQRTQEHAYFWGLVSCRGTVVPNYMIQNYKNDYFLKSGLEIAFILIERIKHTSKNFLIF